MKSLTVIILAGLCLAGCGVGVDEVLDPNTGEPLGTAGSALVSGMYAPLVQPSAPPLAAAVPVASGFVAAQPVGEGDEGGFETIPQDPIPCLTAQPIRPWVTRPARPPSAPR